MQAVNMNRVLSKLNKIVADRFGVDVEFFTMNQSITNSTLETVRRNQGAPMIVSHNSLIIPMRVEGSLLGASKVHNINGLTPKELSQLKDTVEFVLGGALATQQKLDETFETITELELAKEIGKVIPLRFGA